MKSNVRLLVLLLLFGLGAAPAVVAQNRAARSEKHAYHQTQVVPVLGQQRLKLEAQLTAADQAALATYRRQLKELRQQRHALRQSLAPAGPGTTRPAPTANQLLLRQQLSAQTKTLMQAVRAMAQRYQPVIKQLAEEVQPQQQQWVADLRAITLRYATPEQQQRLAAQAPRRLQRSAYFSPTAFLLREAPAALAATIAARRAVSSSLYPNPVATTGQLDFEVAAAGAVAVALLDAQGTQLRTMMAESQAEKGPRTQQLDLRDLPAGLYFYKITTPAGSETKRFIKE
ncbi:T9SS type A sorting domain-containing protein [Hymenobacter sp. IS2118]|uniref:T9SS type A sorting domain-containing protein n=1 Tax=Hymenobacter sp. IS2118 TaxID=1505605 RepID=UPI0005549451|nr:T9SS type A sorting domain-containing protein [Hymenobacter sp. IS2118]